MTNWITTSEFKALPVNEVFHRQLDRAADAKIRNEIRNRHILYRRTWEQKCCTRTMLRISADDYYKLYINGAFVCQGPTASYPARYNFNEVEVTGFVHPGTNTIAVHTYYQGFINRVWVSGDNRHGLWLEMEDPEGNLILKSDSTFRTCLHHGYSAAGISGYQTQFMERYDAGAPECGFEKPDFDDSSWEFAVENPMDDHHLVRQLSAQLVFESVSPCVLEQRGNVLFADFGAGYVGTLQLEASGNSGDEICMRFGMELNDDGSVRCKMRANCEYEEFFRLSGKQGDALNQYDYKAFRYAELIVPDTVSVNTDSIRLLARHYPFELKSEFCGRNGKEKKIWDLCVHTLRYGVQEVMQDCPDREKGYYTGDGCYSLLTYCLLTKNWLLMEKFIDDSLQSRFINRGLVTCLCCSLMQEIAEYPLFLFMSVLEYLTITGNKEFVRQRYKALADILDYYHEAYAEEDGLLNHLDKWCVVEWPSSYRDGYDVDLTAGKVCSTKHNVLNAYYIGAIQCLNKIAGMIGLPQYKDAEPLREAFVKAFFDPGKHLFRDSVDSKHISLPGNVFAWWFQLLPDEETRGNILSMVREKRLSHSMFFVTYAMLCSLARDGEEDFMHELLTDKHGWLNMLAEGATTTFEGWGKELKGNASLFHLTMTYGASFLTDWPIREIFTFQTPRK